MKYSAPLLRPQMNTIEQGFHPSMEDLEQLLLSTATIGGFYALWLVWGKEEAQSLWYFAPDCPLENEQAKHFLLAGLQTGEPMPLWLQELKAPKHPSKINAALKPNLHVSSQAFTCGGAENPGFLVALSGQEILEGDSANHLLKMAGQQATQHFRWSRLNGQSLQVQDHLKRSLAMLEESIESNQIGLWELDIHTGKTIWSELVYAIHEVAPGFDHNQYNGIEFYHPDYRDTITKALEDCIQRNERFDVSCLLITAKGNPRWVRATGRRLGDKVLGSFQDISAIKERELKFRGIFDSSFSFIGFLDTSGVLLEANNTSIRMAGLEPSDVLGKFFWDCYWWQISKQTQEELRQNFLRALEGEEVVYEVAVWIANKEPVTILFSLKPVKDEQGKVAYIIPEGRPIQEIVDTRRRYKFLIEGTNVGTWEWNIQTGETIFNERWAEIIGYSLDELGPISIEVWLSHAHPEDLKKSQERLEACFRGETEYYEIEARMRHKKGHWVWVMDRGKVFEWTDEGKPLKMYGTHQDITPKKMREIEVMYQRDLLSSLFDLAPFGIVLQDCQTDVFLDVNPKHLESIGSSKQEFLEMQPMALVPESHAQTQAEMKQSIKENKRFGPLAMRYYRKDGTTFPAIVRGVAVQEAHGREFLWSFIQDVSEENETKRQLEETLERLHAVMQASTQVCIMATDRNGLFDLFNPGAEELLGYSAQDVLGKQDPEFLFDSRDIEAEEQALREIGVFIKGFKALAFGALAGKPKVREWRLRHKSGAGIPVLMSMTPIRGASGEHGLLAVALDITELKKVETELKTMLEISQKQNESLKNFAHIVSHNLRSHSSGILGVLGFLHEELPELETNEHFSLISNAAKSLHQTVEDLTEVVKISMEPQSIGHVLVHGVVQKNLDSLVSQIKEADIRIDVRLEPWLVVKAVPAYLDSIVLNLISNAIRYASPERTSYLNIYAIERNDKLLICFKDNGLGIDLDKYRGKLFGLYKTFHAHPESRGLGLFISHSQMESMGGSIEVESKPGRGSIFKLIFPK